MILYTTMPQEVMFHQQEDFGKQKTIEVNGISLIVEQTSPTECKIVRLLSTDPSHYLNNSFAPGQMLSYEPQVSM